MPTKPWWQSKTIWSDVVTIGIALYGSVAGNLAPDLGFHLKPIPAAVLTVLGMLGVYGRATANTTLNNGMV
jgi:hypothetical protein